MCLEFWIWKFSTGKSCTKYMRLIRKGLPNIHSCRYIKDDRLPETNVHWCDVLSHLKTAMLLRQINIDAMYIKIGCRAANLPIEAHKA